MVTLPFTGHANSGMSWDEGGDQTQWHWMGKIRQFLETEFFDEIDLNEDDWEPGYTNSCGGPVEEFIDPNHNNESDNCKAEIVYLRRTQEDHKKAIGVIINRTWKWYSITINGDECHDQTTGEGTTAVDVIPGYMEGLSTFGWGSEKLMIPQMGNHNYEIQYFDPFTLEILNIETVGTGIGGLLSLLDYPLLSDLEIEGSKPFYFFKAYRSIDGDEFYPLQQTDHPLQPSGTTSADVIATYHNIQESSNLGFLISPNPTSQHFVVTNYDRGIGQYFLQDSSGRTVLSGNEYSNSVNVNIQNLSAGCYIFTCGSFHAKIIIQ